jgi:hypothetical protein
MCLHKRLKLHICCFIYKLKAVRSVCSYHKDVEVFLCYVVQVVCCVLHRLVAL